MAQGDTIRVRFAPHFQTFSLPVGDPETCRAFNC